MALRLHPSFTVFGLAVQGIFACSNEHDTNPGGGGSAGADANVAGASGAGGSSPADGGGTGGNAGSAAGDASGVSITGRANEFDDSNGNLDLPMAPVSGVEVCVREHAEIACATSDAEGAWSLSGAPPSSELALTFQKDGYISVLRPVLTGLSDVVLQDDENHLLTVQQLEALWAGVSIDPAKGAIAFFATALGTRLRSGSLDWARDVTLSVSPDVGDGPLFLDETGTYVPGATATTGGYGGLLNLDPGDYTLTFTHASSCASIGDTTGGAVYGFPAGVGTEPILRVPVLAGYVTAPIGVFCPSAPPGLSPSAGDAGDAAASDGG